MDIVERLLVDNSYDTREKAADEIERLREEELKMTAHALAQMEEIERLRKFIKEHDMAEVLEDWENS